MHGVRSRAIYKVNHLVEKKTKKQLSTQLLACLNIQAETLAETLAESSVHSYPIAARFKY